MLPVVCNRPNRLDRPHRQPLEPFLTAPTACQAEYKGIEGFCAPLAKCYTSCAGGPSGCINQCAFAGQLAFVMGVIAHSEFPPRPARWPP